MFWNLLHLHVVIASEATRPQGGADADANSVPFAIVAFRVANVKLDQLDHLGIAVRPCGPSPRGAGA
jgi:hypothetical protein